MDRRKVRTSSSPRTARSCSTIRTRCSSPPNGWSASHV